MRSLRSASSASVLQSQTCIKSDVKMRLQLGINSLDSGQGRNSCYLSAPEIQVISPEDVSEKASLQKLSIAGANVIPPIRQMLFPKPNGKIQPSFGVGACAESEAVPRSSVSAIFDLHAGVSKVRDALVNDRNTRDPIICADRHKRWRKISRKA